ncbi:hypothetical protein PVAND_009445 [Polypedilum vanderplanki]|uniref:Uncharacterized protein n=1 Tax=Polypedilum vanderplanki TaxID=319348 RepID=A0A9J6CDA5_POLVA|nr:hypothetical protein PVAND_009445 [Polypedilum vanderplanki]
MHCIVVGIENACLKSKSLSVVVHHQVLPVLESYQFIPHYPTPIMNEVDMSRFCVQLALRKLSNSKVNCVEIDMNDGREPIIEFIGQRHWRSSISYIRVNLLDIKTLELPTSKYQLLIFHHFQEIQLLLDQIVLNDNKFLESIASTIE